LKSYATLMTIFASLAGAFGAWFKRSGRELPDRIERDDLVLLTLAVHKASRLLAKDRVTSAVRAPFTEPEGSAGPGEVSDHPSGSGPRLAIGELITCPYCLGMWVSAAFTAGLLVAPRVTRWIAAVLSAFFGSELLQIVYRKAEDAL
jgi:hypothetical protein